MNRRQFLAGSTILASIPPMSTPAKAQAGRRAVAIMVVGAGPANLAPQGLLQGLEEHGLAVGRDFSVRFVDEGRQHLDSELRATKADLIFAVGSRGVAAARSATKDVPIIGIDLESEPLSEGLVTSFARPGGNLTGMFLDQPTLAAKWLQFLSETVPAISRIAVLRQPQLGTGQWRAAEAAARRSHIALQPFEFEPESLDRAFGDIVAYRPDALIILSSPAVVANRTRIAANALSARIPSITMFRVYAEAGGLLAYGPDPHIMGHRSASYVVRVLRGAPPGTLPIEQPSRFELAVNLATSRDLGLTVPLWVQASADTLIE